MKKAVCRADAGSIMPGLSGEVERLLVRRCLELLGLARRAGELVAGYEKVRAMVAGGGAGALLAARDGAADGRGKLARLAGRVRPPVAVIELFDEAELAGALGRQPVVHVGLGRGPLTRRVIEECKRLAGFRPGRCDGVKAVSEGAEVR